MLKIIKFNDLTDSGLCVKMNDSSHKYNLYQLNKNPILQSQNFERTSVGKGTTSILDLENRSSWTHKFKFSIDLPTEALLFFKQNNILCGKDDISYEYFSLLKYETGDFFLNHRDTNLTDALDDSIHQYTCLIFSIDMYHEVLPIIRGSRWVFKKPLFVKTTSYTKTKNEDEYSIDILNDGGGLFGRHSG